MIEKGKINPMQLPLDANLKNNTQSAKQHAETRFQIISWGHWFALFNVLFCLVLASRYLFIIDWPHTLLGRIYAFTSWIGHFSFLVFALYLLIIFPLSFLLRNPRTLKITAVSIATIGLTVMLVDQQVFATVNLHLNFLVWDLLIEPSYNTNTHEWQLFFAVMPLIFLLQMVYANWSWLKLRSLQRQKWGKWAALFFVSCFMATHLIYAWADAGFYRPITMQKNNYPISYPMTARTFLKNYGLLDADKYEAQLNEELPSSMPDVHYPLNNITVAPIKKGYNVALILFEELDKEAISRIPALNEFSKHAFTFENHFSDQNPDFTLEYGIAPIFSKSILNKHKDSQLNEALALQNYLRADFIIDSLDNANEMDKLQTKDKNSGNNKTMVQLLEKLDTLQTNSQKQSWFLKINLPVLNSNNFDDSLSKLLSTLTEDTNTIVILTAKNSTTAADLTAISDFIPQKVPLLMRWPDVTVDVPTDKITTHQDIVRTIIERVLRAQNPASDYSQGEDIFYPTRQNLWWVDGRTNQIVIQTTSSTVVLKQNSYEMWDRSKIGSASYSKPLEASKLSLSPVDKTEDEFRRQQLGFVLQALMDIQRFWAD